MQHPPCLDPTLSPSTSLSVFSSQPCPQTCSSSLAARRQTTCRWLRILEGAIRLASRRPLGWNHLVHRYHRQLCRLARASHRPTHQPRRKLLHRSRCNHGLGTLGCLHLEGIRRGTAWPSSFSPQCSSSSSSVWSSRTGAAEINALRTVRNGTARIIIRCKTAQLGIFPLGGSRHEQEAGSCCWQH